MIKTAVIIGLTILVLIVLVESQNLDDEIDDEEYSDSPVKEYIEDELEEEEFFDEEEDFDPNLFERDSDGVLILNPDNFATAIQLYDFLLVHFCKLLMILPCWALISRSQWDFILNWWLLIIPRQRILRRLWSVL